MVINRYPKPCVQKAGFGWGVVADLDVIKHSQTAVYVVVNQIKHTYVCRWKFGVSLVRRSKRQCRTKGVGNTSPPYDIRTPHGKQSTGGRARPSPCFPMEVSARETPKLSGKPIHVGSASITSIKRKGVGSIPCAASSHAAALRTKALSFLVLLISSRYIQARTHATQHRCNLCSSLVSKPARDRPSQRR